MPFPPKTPLAIRWKCSFCIGGVHVFRLGFQRRLSHLFCRNMLLGCALLHAMFLRGEPIGSTVVVVAVLVVVVVVVVVIVLLANRTQSYRDLRDP
jgi:hypothetical protein